MAQSGYGEAASPTACHPSGGAEVGSESSALRAASTKTATFAPGGSGSELVQRG
ncbi:MAG TPA: hypothetical protein VNA25_12960 [Phycisphaerae bacterium]|nr:hypothetical protein [Phycisphaerae bacterium]